MNNKNNNNIDMDDAKCSCSESVNRVGITECFEISDDNNK